jgi:hypothetical protein
VRSWFGDDLDHRNEVRELVHLRKSSPNPGHLFGASEDAQAGADLAREGESWFARVERARRQWQTKGWLGGASPFGSGGSAGSPPPAETAR